MHKIPVISSKLGKSLESLDVENVHPPSVQGIAPELAQNYSEIELDASSINSFSNGPPLLRYDVINKKLHMFASVTSLIF